jgi:hypothetical protein
MSNFALSQPLRLSEFADLATNFICQACVIISTSGSGAPQALIADLRPGLVFTHGSLGGVSLATQRFIAASARSICAVSLGFVFRKTVRRTMRRPGAIKVADPAVLSTEVKAQFPKLAANLSRIGLPQEGALISQ